MKLMSSRVETKGGFKIMNSHLLLGFSIFKVDAGE